MPTTAEIVERLTRELTLQKILDAARELKDINELIKYLEAQIDKN